MASGRGQLQQPPISRKNFHPAMKKAIWKTSSKRGKQRKAHYTATGEERAKRTSGHLSEELRGKWGFRSAPLAAGDTVRVMRGKYTGNEGAITKISSTEYKVYVEGCFVTKTDGTNALVPIYPSNLTILRFRNAEGRMEALNREKERREKAKSTSE
jgi:ribosomal protein uL24